MMMAVKRKISPTHEAPYRGLRVLDFGQGIASPYAAMLLGIYGADVIKVEPPDGDTTRQAGHAKHPGMGAVFLTIGRNKRSVVIDLKTQTLHGGPLPPWVIFQLTIYAHLVEQEYGASMPLLPPTACKAWLQARISIPISAAAAR